MDRLAASDVLGVIRARLNELERQNQALRLELCYANEARERLRIKGRDLKRSRDRWRASAQSRQALLENRSSPRIARGAIGYATDEERLEATRARWRRAQTRYRERRKLAA